MIPIISITAAGMRLGQGMMTAAANNNNRSSSGNKLNTHTDSGDGHEGGGHSSSFHNNNHSHNRSHHHQQGGSGSGSDGEVPTEFLCAINGHVMKAPMRCRDSGLVFEKATIELWLTSRGSVCPITVRNQSPSYQYHNLFLSFYFSFFFILPTHTLFLLLHNNLA